MTRWRRWSGPRGSIEHPESALELRLVLAAFGLVVCAIGAVLAAVADMPVVAVLLGVFAAVALVDIVVVQRRRNGR